MKQLLFAVLAAVLLTACPFPAQAKPHQLSWVWPVTYCPEEGQTIGDPLSIASLVESELIYSTNPMPMNSDTDGPCASTPDAEPPAGAISVPITIPDTSVTLNLQPGQTYYARIRVAAPTAGNWSSWSAQATFTVPYGKPNVIQFTSGHSPLDQHRYVLVTTSHLRFFGG